MIYLDNKTLLQELYIPRQEYISVTTGSGGTYAEGYADGVNDQKAKLASTAFTENGDYQRNDGWSAITVNVPQSGSVLEGKEIVVSQDVTIVVPTSGYDGFSAVTVDATEYGQTNYDLGYSEGENDGYISGVTDGEQSVIDTFTSTTITENGQYGSSANPLSSITVNVDTASTYQSGYTSGETHQKSLLGTTAFTINGSYSAENGYSAITVNVPQTGSSLNIEANHSFTATSNGDYTITPSSGSIIYDAMSSVTLNVNVPQIFYADYIHTETLTADTYEDYIDTGLFPTTAITFRVKGYRKGLPQSNRIVGWCPNETTHSDNDDFRLFWINNGESPYFDWSFDRINKAFYFDGTSGYTDITCGNYYVYDNVEEQTIVSGSVKGIYSLYSGGTIRADVGSWWLQSLEIYDGNTLLFDGKAAYDSDGNVGLFDSVSKTLKLPITNKQMVYELEGSSLGNGSFSANGSYSASTDNLDGYSAITVNVPQTSGVYGTKTITINGTYSASTDNFDGYSAITVNVPQSGSTEKEIIICTSGGCWFNTNYDLVFGDSIEIEHCTFGTYDFPSSRHQQYIGGGTGEILRIGQAGWNHFYIKYFNNPNSWVLPISASPTEQKYAIEDKTVVLNSTGFSIDGTVICAYTATYNSVTPKLTFFANTSSGGDVVNGQTAKMGRVKIYGSDGTLKATFEPRLDEFNVPYFKYIEQDIDIYASGYTAPFYEEIIIDLSYQSGYTDGYQSGYTDGEQIGYNSGYTDGEASVGLSALTISANTAITVNSGGYSAITVNVPTTVNPNIIAERNFSFSNPTINTTNIQEFAFEGANLTGVLTIGSAVTNIYAYAFRYAPITAITFPLTIVGNEYGKMVMAGYGQFTYTNIVTLDVPNYLEFTDNGSTNNSTGIFESCTALTTVNWKAYRVPKYTFRYCSSLNAITLVDVEYIDRSAFTNCSSLTQINCSSTIAPTITNENAFQGVPSTGTVHYPQGSDYSSWQSNTYLSGWTFVADL